MFINRAGHSLVNLKNREVLSSTCVKQVVPSPSVPLHFTENTVRQALFFCFDTKACPNWGADSKLALAASHAKALEKITEEVMEPIEEATQLMQLRRPSHMAISILYPPWRFRETQ